MTTPATARELAKLLDKMGDLHAQMALINLADQVEVLTKECDALRSELARPESTIVSIMRAEHDTLNTKIDTLQDHIIEVTSEEHSIPELRNQLIEAFEEKRKCYFALSQQAKATENLIKERDALMAAGKLALDALVFGTTDQMSNQRLAKLLVTINALKQAGVK